jgi:UDPglucose--hexose-1-phosphate uridylyltransferase
MPEFRKDFITGRCTIIASERAKRPRQAFCDSSSPSPESCPFCPGHEDQTPPEVLAYREPGTQPNGPGWTVRVVPNKYPAVLDDEGAVLNADGLHKASRAVGVHEVIIEAPAHVKSMTQLSERQIAAVLQAYSDRVAALKKDPRWRYVLIYKNQGATAGATLEHAHSQLIALPEIPPAVAQEMKGARDYFASLGRCCYCDIVQMELCQRQRLIAVSERFIVFCPHAARFPYETWILPKRHSPFFECSGGDEYDELARCLREVLSRLERALDSSSLNYVIHSNSSGEGANVHDHWRFEILPKTTQVAGFEWGSGAFINPVAPENAARMMRELVL